jgi:ATP-binding cassette subfamily B protein
MERVRWFQDVMALILRLGLIVFALYLWQINSITVAQFVMVASLGLLIVANAKYLSYQFLHFFESSGNIQNSVDTLIKPHEYPDPETARNVVIKHGAIELKNITFGYSVNHPILENFSLTIPAGQRVGVVGYSGSGKSTLLNLLLRLYEPQQGSILIDGFNIHEITYESLYEQVGLIPQEPGLFHRSLSENIGYGKANAEQCDIEIAAARAHAHDFIKQMDSGYNALVGERGFKLSGGQRQRIVIARVLLKNAPILIMDEATSSLDSETERLIQNSLDEIMGDKTVLVVAHRLSTIAHLDRILVMDKGRLIEDGTHQQLLARKGAYASLWAHQADGSFGIALKAAKDEMAPAK